MDYRKLCIDLFGTDDEKELRDISGKIKNGNQRNAGRKKGFTENEVKDIRNMRMNGIPVREIAEKYHTSRQVIGRYLIEPHKKNCTMRITYMYRTFACTIIDVDFENEQIYIQNLTNDFLFRAFGVVENPTWEDFQYFLEDRCVPKTRGNIKDILRELDLTDYDPLQIVEKTKGRMAGDDMWMKFTYYRKER